MDSGIYQAGYPEPAFSGQGVFLPPNPLKILGDMQISKQFNEFWKLYPRRFGKDSACRDWVSEVTEENESQVFECLKRYLKSAEVARGCVMSAGSTLRDTGWIVKCARDDWESEWPPAVVPKGMSVFETPRPCFCGAPSEQRGLCRLHLAEMERETA
jgi:hypothetical protein